MKITNNTGLPAFVVRAAENDQYSKDGADFTSSQLPNPPRAEALKFLNTEGLEIDVSVRPPSMLGTAIHKILELGARPTDVVEKRYFAEFLGLKVGGKIDLYEPDTKVLYEVKSCLTKAFDKKHGGGKKSEWIAQASINRCLMKLNGIDVDRVVIVGWLVDWRPWMDGVALPQVEIETWGDERTLSYIEERVRLHLEARKNLPLCTSKETWSWGMCKNYCEASKICEQYQKGKQTGVMESK